MGMLCVPYWWFKPVVLAKELPEWKMFVDSSLHWNCSLGNTDLAAWPLRDSDGQWRSVLIDTYLHLVQDLGVLDSNPPRTFPSILFPSSPLYSFFSHTLPFSGLRENRRRTSLNNGESTNMSIFGWFYWKQRITVTGKLLSLFVMYYKCCRYPSQPGRSAARSDFFGSEVEPYHSLTPVRSDQATENQLDLWSKDTGWWGVRTTFIFLKDTEPVTYKLITFDQSHKGMQYNHMLHILIELLNNRHYRQGGKQRQRERERDRPSPISRPRFKSLFILRLVLFPLPFLAPEPVSANTPFQSSTAVTAGAHKKWEEKTGKLAFYFFIVTADDSYS